MTIFKPILNFYINSSVHVALGVLSLSCITLKDFGLPLDINVLSFIFFAAITGYNFVKYFGMAKFHHRSLTSWLKLIQVFSLFCFVLMCYYAFKLEDKTLLYIGAFALVTFLYAIPILPNRLLVDEHNNLRSITGLKVYVIALVWSGVTVFLPLLNANYLLGEDVIITGVQRFIFVILLMLPFEIRDLLFDSLKLSTIPQQIGVKKTKLMGFLLALVCFLLEFFKNEINVAEIWALFVTLVVTLVLLKFAKREQGKYYCSFWVEGVPVLWLVLFYLFN